MYGTYFFEKLKILFIVEINFGCYWERTFHADLRGDCKIIILFVRIKTRRLIKEISFELKMCESCL